MSKINEIQNKLGELNGGQFQKLMDAYFAKEYKGELYPIGSVLENNNTKTGTPDTLIKPHEEKYVFIEYTVQKNKIVSKFKDDIQKCLDNDKTGIPNVQIGKIICCCNTRLGSQDIEEIISEGRIKGINIEVVSLDSLAYKLINYPVIINDFLGVSIDTQQILDLEDFIKFNDSGKLATPLDIDIFGRDEEITNIIKSINENQITVLSGLPGVGKTRLSLESIREFRVKHTEYELKCLRNNGQNLYDDLNLYFNKPGYYLLMVDDANLMTNIQLILDLFSWESRGVHIKLVLTVREYAEHKIIDKISKYQYRLFKIKPLKEENIKILCEHFEIINPKYIERIYEISKGNSRLAIMACTTAKRENNLNSIANAVDLVESYYKDVKLHFETELENKDLLKVAAILSFLNHINLKDDENVEIICKITNIEKETFLNLISKLHYMEIVDIYEDELVKISDQILSVYLFYLTIIKEKLLSYEYLVDNYYPRLKNRIIENLNNIFSYFYKEENLEVVKMSIKKKYDKDIKNGSEEEIEEYLKLFWFALEIEGLLYSQNKIEGFPIEETVSYKFELTNNNKQYSSILCLLSQYKYSRYPLEAIDLILLYLEKKPSEFSSVYHVLTDNFGFDEKSENLGYKHELGLLKRIEQRYSLKKDALYTNFLVGIIQYYLKFNHEHTKLKSNNMIKYYNIPLYLEYDLPKVREIAWRLLGELYSQQIHLNDIHELLYNYARGNIDFLDIGILKFDKSFIEIIINKKKEFTLEQSIVFNRLKNLLQRYEIHINDDLEELLDTYEYLIYRKLFSEEKFEEADRIAEERDLSTWAIELTENNFRDVFKICKEIDNIEYLNSKKYVAGNRIETLILNAPQNNRIEILGLFFHENIQIYVYPEIIVKSIVDLEQLEEIIVPLEFYNKSYWLFCIYRELSLSNPNSVLLNKIYKYFDETKGEAIGYFGDISFLESFIEIDDKVFINVINTLLRQGNAVDVRRFEHFLNNFINNERCITIYLKNNIDLLENLYLTCLRTKRHFDYNSGILKALTRRNPNILKEILEKILEDETNTYRLSEDINLQFIWEEENWRELSGRIGELIQKYIKVPNKFYATVNLLENLLHIGNRGSTELNNRAFEWIDSKIISWSEDEELIKVLFECLSNFNDDKQIKWIIKLIQIKTEFEFFKKIPLLPRTLFWSGSDIPMLRNRQLFYTQLENKMQGIQFLQHKHWLQQKIDSIEQRIREVKIQELIEDI